jgi:hypothetical protein
MSNGPEMIAIEKISPHPHNPRINGHNEETVAKLSALIGDSFDPAHSIKVRPKDGGYQVISGHHRLEASKRNGIKSLPCWVREMDDDEANLHLLTDNTQGELCSIEKAIHLHRSIVKGDRGRGNESGFRRYARAMDSDEKLVRKLWNAGEVAEKCGLKSAFYKDKAMHLDQVHRLPEDSWEEWCELILIAPEDFGTVAKIKKEVDMALDPDCERRLKNISISGVNTEISKRDLVNNLWMSFEGMRTSPEVSGLSAEKLAEAFVTSFNRGGNNDIYWTAVKDMVDGIERLSEVVSFLKGSNNIKPVEG